MNVSKIIALFLLLAFASGCVTNKQFTYFQNDDLYLDAVKDSIYRSYDLPHFDYKLLPYDVLSIKFFSLTGEELNIFKREQSTTAAGGGGGMGNMAVLGGYMIDEYGNLSFPVVGKVKVIGLTLSEVEEKLKQMADQYLDEPVVEVKMLNYRFTILGEVSAEGTVTTFNYAVNIPEALGLAGGVTDLADKSNIKIIRRFGDTNKVFYVNVLEEDFFSKENFYIHPNDIVIVPPIKQRPFRKYFSQNLSVFTSSLSVLLVGMNLYFLINSN